MSDVPTGSAPCPCGSGKKNSQCCGFNDTEPIEQQKQKKYAELRRVEGTLVPAVFDFIETLDSEAVDSAWLAFQLDQELDPDDESLLQMFASWLLFDWPGIERADAPTDALPQHIPLCEVFLGENFDLFKVDHEQRLFMKAGEEAPFSWYQVTESRPGSEIILVDLLLGKSVIVREHRASKILEVGEIILCRVISMRGIAAFFGLYPWAAPAPAAHKLTALVTGLSTEWQRVAQEAGMPLHTTRDIVVRGTFMDLVEEIYERSARDPSSN